MSTHGAVVGPVELQKPQVTAQSSFTVSHLPLSFLFWQVFSGSTSVHSSLSITDRLSKYLAVAVPRKRAINKNVNVALIFLTSFIFFYGLLIEGVIKIYFTSFPFDCYLSSPH